jgi:hypothetical protein
MTEFKNQLKSILGVELTAPLFVVNADSFQGILSSILHKIQEFHSRFDRLESDIDAKANKTEITALKVIF